MKEKIKVVYVSHSLTSGIHVDQKKNVEENLIIIENKKEVF